MAKLLLRLCMMLFVFVLAMGMASAQTKLFISDVELDVKNIIEDDEDEEGIKNGDVVSPGIYPGAELEFTIEVTNNFTNAEDIEIEDIEIEVTINDLDDGSDEEEDVEIDDLDATDDDDEKVKFDVPIDVGEDNFKVTIDIEGKTDNNGTHKDSITFDIEVEKENNQLYFTRADVNPSQVACSRSVQVGVGLINIGQDDEEDVVLTVSNSQLGISEREVFDLDEGDFDNDMRYSKTFTIQLEDDAKSGVYPLQIAADYDDGDEREVKTVDVTVAKCEDEKPEEPEPTNTNSGSNSNTQTEPVVQQPVEDTTVVITQPQATQPAQTTTQPDTARQAQVIQPSDVQSAQESGSNNTWLYVAGGLLWLIIVIGLVALIVNLLRNR